MKNDNPSGGRLQFASAGQRLFSMLLFAVFAALIWVAWSGKYDREVNHVAAWMRTHWDALFD